MSDDKIEGWVIPEIKRFGNILHRSGIKPSVNPIDLTAANAAYSYTFSSALTFAATRYTSPRAFAVNGGLCLGTHR